MANYEDHDLDAYVATLSDEDYEAFTQPTQQCAQEQIQVPQFDLGLDESQELISPTMEPETGMNIMSCTLTY